MTSSHASTGRAGQQHQPRISYPVLCAGLALLLILLSGVSLLTGPAELSMGDLWRALTNDHSDRAVLIMQEIRLPRTMLALFIGGALGASGAAMQGLLRNPLAEPGVIGVSASAALGAVIAFYTGLSSIVPLALPGFAIMGALACVLILFLLAGQRSTLTLILAGVAISSLAGALISLILNLSPNPFAAYEAFFWMLGSLTDRSMMHVQIAVPLILAGWGLLFWSARDLDALSLGEEAATSMGVNVQRSMLVIVLGTALSVGAGVAVSGIIGFVGLVIPHLLRPLVAHQPGKLLLPSLLGGAGLLLAADIAVRLIPAGNELKLGVITALIGAPFFLYLVIAMRFGGQR